MAKSPKKPTPKKKTAPAAPVIRGTPIPPVRRGMAAAQLQESSNYWTEERIRKAEPIPLPTIPSQTVPSLKSSLDFTLPLRITPMGPDNHLMSLSGGPLTRQVSDLTVAPYRAVGRVLSRFPGGDTFGTAWVIGEATIVTAGHCVFSPKLGGDALSLEFQAQYDNGRELGRWEIPGSNFTYPQGWANQGSNMFQFDMAFCIATELIRPTTGKLGYLANFPANQGPVHSIGYPQKATNLFAFNGQFMWESIGHFVGQLGNVFTVANNMTPGCSGGPITVLKDGEWYANGLNSHRPSTSPNVMNSPYFGNAFLGLIQWMTDNGGDG